MTDGKGTVIRRVYKRRTNLPLISPDKRDSGEDQANEQKGQGGVAHCFFCVNYAIIRRPGIKAVSTRPGIPVFFLPHLIPA